MITASTTRKWQHASVKAFAGSDDPIGKITTVSRNLALKAIDQGWSGPPYDPFRLADLLRIHVTPNALIQDARLLPQESGGFVIEFNPNRSTSRIRYSIAHEISHTLFSDCAQRVRYRQKHNSLEEHSWELELLCNIAAAEILMPIGSLRSVMHEDAGITEILEWRKEFQVSSEAILIRYAHLVEKPVAIFAASRASASKSSAYKIDYLVASRANDLKIKKGFVLPAESAVSQCTAIGYTATKAEIWDKTLGEFRVECVGVPPYPGDTFPRVVGLIKPEEKIENETKIYYLKGNALEPRGNETKVIAHVVNNKATAWGGAGFAKQLKAKYPKAETEYKAFFSANRPLFKLGNIHTAQVADDLYIVSMIAQKGYGPGNERRLQYSALDQCLTTLRDVARMRNASVHMPRIGTGQAGGSWEVIEEMIINQLIRAGIQVTIYDLPD